MLKRLCLGHLSVKLVTLIFVLACDKNSVANVVLGLLMIGGEWAFSSFKTARKMITAKWWTIVNPEGKVENFVQVTDSRNNGDELPVMKLFWMIQLVFCGIWALVTLGHLHRIGFCVVPATALYLHYKLIKFHHDIQKDVERSALENSMTASADMSVNIEALKTQQK